MQALADLMPHIPAMTTKAERELYYRLVKENAHKGAVVELGAWLGASSAWIAAAMRDSTGGRAHVFDRFKSKPGHAEKVKAFYANHGGEGEMALGDCEAQFRKNLGALIDFVEVHRGEIDSIRWEGPISVLITDAPKRVPQISSVLTNLRDSIQPGAIMAWQDFCHFPSYEIPACLYLLRDHLSFIEAAVPGTTLAFEVISQWSLQEVSPAALAVRRWTPAKIDKAWEFWLDIVPEEKQSLFRCGKAMFLCDIGADNEAVEALRSVISDDPEAVMPKWRYLYKNRPSLVTRYSPLFKELTWQNLLAS